MPSILDYAPLYAIFDVFGKNDNFKEQLPKKDIYQTDQLREFDLSTPNSK